MSKLFRRLWVGLFLLFGLPYASHANEIVHWELDAFLDVPWATNGSQRTFTSSFDYNLLTKAVSNITFKTVGTVTPNCLLCEEYTGAEGVVVYDLSTGLIPVGVQWFKEVPPSEAGVLYEGHTLQIFGFDINQPGTFSGLYLREYVAVLLDSEWDDDIIFEDYCDDCATLLHLLRRTLRGGPLHTHIHLCNPRARAGIDMDIDDEFVAAAVYIHGGDG